MSLSLMSFAKSIRIFTSIPEFSMTEFAEEWCIYDAGDDCIIVRGSYIDMEDLIETMAGNLMVITMSDVTEIRNKRGAHHGP
jgi:hypothetical protein